MTIEEIVCYKCGYIDHLNECPFCEQWFCEDCMEEHDKEHEGD